MLEIDGGGADDVVLADVRQDLRGYLVELVVAGVNAFVVADRPHADLFVRALGDGLERHGRFLDEAFAGRAPHRHLQMKLHLGRGGRRHGAGREARRMRFFGRNWRGLGGFFGDRDGFTASRARQLRAGALGVHGQFLATIGAIEDDFHKRALG